MRSNNIEKFRANLHNSFEMSETRLGTSPIEKIRRQLKLDHFADRINLLGRRTKKIINFRPLKHQPIFLEISRIPVEILTRPKLRRIYENTRHHGVALTLRFRNKTQMPFMQSPHRRNKPYRPPLLAGQRHHLPDYSYRFENLHSGCPAMRDSLTYREGYRLLVTFACRRENPFLHILFIPLYRIFFHRIKIRIFS